MGWLSLVFSPRKPHPPLLLLKLLLSLLQNSPPQKLPLSPPQKLPHLLQKLPRPRKPPHPPLPLLRRPIPLQLSPPCLLQKLSRPRKLPRLLLPQLLILLL